MIKNSKQQTVSSEQLTPKSRVDNGELIATNSLHGFTTQRAERTTHVLIRGSEASVGSKTVRGFTTRSEQYANMSHIRNLRAPEEQNLRGFTLLIAIILSSVVVTVGLALLDVAYKQVVLSSSAKQSQYAFYAADSGLECALYWDQKFDAFDYASGNRGYSTLLCGGQTITPAFDDSGTIHITKFSVPCVGGGNSADVSIYRKSTGEATLYADGYSSCLVSDTRRIERGLKITY